MKTNIAHSNVKNKDEKLSLKINFIFGQPRRPIRLTLVEVDNIHKTRVAQPQEEPTERPRGIDNVFHSAVFSCLISSSNETQIGFYVRNVCLTFFYYPDRVYCVFLRPFLRCFSLIVSGLVECCLCFAKCYIQQCSSYV